MTLKNESGINNLKKQYTKNMNNISEESVNDTHASVETKPEQTTEQEPQQNKNNSNKEKKYLRLDITDYQEYISLMADHEKAVNGKYVSMTQYILRLIEADKQKNIELYEKLEQIEQMKRELL